MEVQNHLQGRNKTRDETIEGSRSDGSTISDVAILVGLKGGHNACIKLTMKLGGRGPKFVEVKTPCSNMTSLLVHKIFFCR